MQRGEKEMNRLEVKTDKLQFILAIMLGLFFVPFGLWSLIRGLLTGFSAVPLIMGFMALLLYGVVVWLVFRGYFQSVKYFSHEGLVRNDGRNFAWADLSRVVNQITTNPRTGNSRILWRTEIQFKNGESAWLIPVKVSNFREVSEYVANLPCEHTEVRV
jgi:hypothetical protein